MVKFIAGFLVGLFLYGFIREFSDSADNLYLPPVLDEEDALEPTLPSADPYIIGQLTPYPYNLWGTHSP